MKLKLGMTLIGAAAFALSACGGGAKISSKTQAESLAMGAPTSGSANGMYSPMGLALQAAYPDAFGTHSPIEQAMQKLTSGTASATVSCPKGGKLTVNYDYSATQTTGDISLAVTYNGCQVAWDDPDTATVETSTVTYDGTWTLTVNASGSGGTGSVSVKMSGQIDLSGAVSDSIKGDLTVTATANNGTYSATVDGTITTNESSYSFSGDVTNYTPPST